MADTVVAVPLPQVSRALYLISPLFCGHYEIDWRPPCQGAGYGVVVGLGALFALGMNAISEVMKRRGNVENAEEFTGK